MSRARLALCLALGALFAAPGVAAQQYRLPLELPSSGTQPYITAYRDHDSSGGLQDWNCQQKTYDGHKGTDFGIGSWPVMDAGSRWVVAAADGKVVFTNDGCDDRCTTGSCGCGSGFGNYVKVEHADGKSTYYGHLMLGSLTVGVGDQVKCGQHLGKVGSSGNSTGPHLHFEPRYASNASDDPFAGSCGGPTSFWVSQGAYLGLPADQCENPPPPPLDDAKLVSETLPDGSVVAAGQAFDKTWVLENTGNTTWTKAEGYALVQSGGDALGATPPVALGDAESIAPSAQKTWTLSLTAPTTPGTFSGDFRMDHSGTGFGPTLHVEIVVEQPSAGGGGSSGTGGWGAGTGASVSTSGGSGGANGAQQTKLEGDVSGGCACRFGSAGAPSPRVLLLLGLVGLVRRRRARR